MLCSIVGASPVLAKVVNVEFKFTPYTGDSKQDKVQGVEGKATVYLNGVYVAQQPIQAGEMPVLFEQREIAPAVWIPVESLGSMVRKGKNTLRIEFVPTDATKPYKAQLGWASVTDEVKEEKGPGTGHATNQANEGKEEKENVTGPLTMEREFVADFAKPQPWHSYPPVTSITPDDEQKLGALVTERVAWFKPPFTKLYEALDVNERVEPDEIKKAKCIEAAYAAGFRLTPAPTGDLEYTTTGGPEVVVRSRSGQLYEADQKAFESIKGDGRLNADDMQMCAGIALSIVYPPRVVAVRKPDGTWQALP
jgi:hypothetical protein